LLAVFLGAAMLLEEAGAGAGAAAAGDMTLVLGFIAGAAGAVLTGAACAAAALDFLLLFFAVDAAGAAVSAAAGVEVLSAASFLVFFDFFVDAAVLSLAADLPAAAVLSSAAAASFLAFFLDFLVVVSALVPVELACAFAKEGEMATVSIRQKASIHRANFFWE